MKKCRKNNKPPTVLASNSSSPRDFHFPRSIKTQTYQLFLNSPARYSDLYNYCGLVNLDNLSDYL